MYRNHTTLRKLLQVALMPLGKTLYIWDGGWNKDDATRMGTNPQWESFFWSQDGSYNCDDHEFEHGNGLDCSGYLSWVLYNSFNTESGGEDFVCYAREMAASLAARGFGELTPQEKVQSYRPGDVFSNKGHCWLCLGSCEDGSVLLVHSSPPGVQLGGTHTTEGVPQSQAYELARQTMQRCCPEWSARYAPRYFDYLGVYERFRWNYGQTMRDEEGLRELSAPELVARLLPVTPAS